MPRLVTDWLRRAVIIASLCSPLFAAETALAQGQTGYVLTTTNTLITIDVNNPGAALASVPIVGVAAGETLVGIDVRPENGFLYALGVNHTADTMSVYAISVRTGQAGLVGAGGFTGAGNLPDPAVARYGIDFNPAVDRLRVTTNQSGAGPAVPGLNFRINVTTGTLVVADTDINPAPISIDEVAYTNNGRQGAITTLYTISSAQDALYIQNPPNAGTQAAPIALSQNLTAVHGFDMDSQAVTTASNMPVTAASTQAFAVVTTAGGATGLVRINLLTGAVGAVAPIANSTTNIRGFAVRDVRVPGSFPSTALDPTGPALIRFNTATPGTTTTSALAGVAAGEVMVGIDLRPQTGQLYGLGYNSGTNTVQLYRIEPWTTLLTSTVTAVGTPFVLPTAGATAFGFDFNPTVDRVRVVTNAGDNFRLNPNNGAVAGVDGAVNPVGTIVTGAAYTNSFGQPLTGGTTTLYTLDATNDALLIQTPPNNGTQTASKTVTLNGAPLNFTAANGFDIAPDVRVDTSNVVAAGKSYAFLIVAGVANLYTIDLSTGAAALIGGASVARAGLAIGEGPIQITTTTLTASPAQVPVGEPVTFTASVSPADATGTVTFFVNGNPVATVPIAGGQASFTTNTLGSGNYQVTASYSGGFNAGASSAPTPFALVVGQYKQHFAEGATGFYQTDIGVVNASATQTANITVSLFPENAASFEVPLTLAPRARRTLDVNALMAAQGLDSAVSTLVTSDQPIGATRQMTYGNPVYGSTLESGVPDTALTWYFAEGATSVFSLYFLIENPNSAQTDVTFTHLPEGGAAPVMRTVSVPGLSRRTFNVNEVPGLAEAALSTVITSTLPIVAERAMYITSASSRLFEAGTASAGATALSANWSFAEGATGFFFTYLLLGNPNSTPADVTVVYQLPDGTTIPRTYTVQGQSRRTVDVAFEDPLLASATFSMALTSTQPIVAERAMWWGLPFREGSVALGTTTTGALWAIGEGAEAGVNDDSTFVLVSNGSASAATVRFTVVYDDGTASEQLEYSMAATSRLTVRIGADFPTSVGKRFSVLVESLTPTAPITVEYARYQSAGAFLDAGGAALATRVR